MHWSYVSLALSYPYINGLVQDCSNSIANALELQQSCAKPSIYFTISVHNLTSELHRCSLEHGTPQSSGSWWASRVPAADWTAAAGRQGRTQQWGLTAGRFHTQHWTGNMENEIWHDVQFSCAINQPLLAHHWRVHQCLLTSRFIAPSIPWGVSAPGGKMLKQLLKDHNFLNNSPIFIIESSTFNIFAFQKALHTIHFNLKSCFGFGGQSSS